MLLIDDDQPQMLERQKQGRTRADHKLRPAFSHHPPAAPPLGHRDTRVPFGRARPEPGLDAGEEFRRQCNLGQQNQRLTPLRQTGGDGLHVDFGFA